MKADVATDRHQIGARQPLEGIVEHGDFAVLHRAQRPDETKQRRFAGTRRPRHDDQLARRHIQPIIEQHLVAGGALAEKMIQSGHPDEGGTRLATAVEHQNTSAGSATITFRIAIIPAATHMTSVSARVVKVSESVICKGPTAMPPMT